MSEFEFRIGHKRKVYTRAVLAAIGAGHKLVEAPYIDLPSLPSHDADPTTVERTEAGGRRVVVEGGHIALRGDDIAVYPASHPDIPTQHPETPKIG